MFDGKKYSNLCNWTFVDTQFRLNVNYSDDRIPFWVRLYYTPHRPPCGNKIILMESHYVSYFEVARRTVPLCESASNTDVFRRPSLSEASDEELTEMPHFRREIER